MKISLKGKVKLRGRAIAIGRGGSRRSNSSALRRAIREDLRRGIRQLRRDLRAARIGIRRDLRRELYSPRFAGFIRRAVAGDGQFREILEGLLNQDVAVTTTAGTVNGTVIEVGNNYAVLQETPNTILVIPFQNMNSVQPL